MPTYEYECPHCNNGDGRALVFQVRQTDYDRHLVRCPKCRAVARRLMSSGTSYSFGWRLTERSHTGGVGDPKDEVEKDI